MVELPEPRGPFQWASQAWGPVLHCAPLGRLADHCFTTRSLALDGRGLGHGWDVLATAIGVPPGKLIRLRQVHAIDITVVQARDETPESHDGTQADIVLSAHRGVAVVVQVADCVPLLLADAKTGAVAAVHAGWRGLAAGAVRVAVRGLMREFGSRPRDLMAAVGPSIGPCCYEVGEDVRAAFDEHGFDPLDVDRWFAVGANSRFYLDLWTATCDQLHGAGLPRSQIYLCGLCTSSHPSLFWSYRRDGAAAGRMVGIIRTVRRTQR